MIAFSGRKGGEFDIYTINLDGSGRRQLTFNSGSNESPSWSPEGRYIVFSSDRSCSKKIYIMFANGSGERAITWEKVMIQTLIGLLILTIARSNFKVKR